MGGSEWGQRHGTGDKLRVCREASSGRFTLHHGAIPSAQILIDSDLHRVYIYSIGMSQIQ